jgi:ketosteroid isomerase-like protein
MSAVPSDAGAGFRPAADRQIQRDTAQAMSQENVEIVKGFLASAERNEWDQAAQLLDPDVELHGTVGGLAEGSVWRGFQQIRQEFQQEDAEAWDERRLEAEEFIEAGDRVVVFLHEFRRGRGSGVELETETAVVCELGDGRVIRIQGYMDRAAAVEAAGLRE